MESRINRQWVLAARPEGMVRQSDFAYRETEVQSPENGAFLVRNLYISFEPAMRGWIMDRPSYIPPVNIGEVMRAAGVGQVVESRHPAFNPGDFVQGFFGWQDFFATKGQEMIPIRKIAPGQSLTHPLGLLGLNGLTAYFGFLDLGRPRVGDTVVVSAAAGATGSVVGQIAKIKGCRTIGIAGGPEKCRWLTRKAAFDAAIDYKSENDQERLAERCPKGIDIFFDNVGGEILDAALARIAFKARVVLCGGISHYNEETPSPGPKNYLNLVMQRGRMEGFIVLDYAARFDAALQELAQWVTAGKIAFEEDIQEGFENIPKTFLRLFSGKNFGKQLLKIAAPTID